MPTLLPPLQALLDAELAAGNAVTETSSWPPQLELTVFLRYRFQRRYELPEMHYSVTNDPHYWFAEYTCTDGQRQQMLACGFEMLPQQA